MYIQLLTDSPKWGIIRLTKIRSLLWTALATRRKPASTKVLWNQQLASNLISLPCIYLLERVPMPLKRETTRPGFLLNSVDRHGRPIDPGVLSVAQEISQQALAYGEKILGDPAVIQNLFEEAAAAVSEAAETKRASDKPPIRDLRAYLFRTFARRIAREKRKEAALRNEINLKERNRQTSGATGFARELLLDEVMAACDKVTQEIAL